MNGDVATGSTATKNAVVHVAESVAKKVAQQELRRLRSNIHCANSHSLHVCNPGERAQLPVNVPMIHI